MPPASLCSSITARIESGTVEISCDSCPGGIWVDKYPFFLVPAHDDKAVGNSFNDTTNSGLFPLLTLLSKAFLSLSSKMKSSSELCSEV